jgi:hypothetical protein
MAWEDEINHIFHLISMNDSHSIMMFIKKEKLQYIEILQPLEKGGTQRVHLILKSLH